MRKRINVLIIFYIVGLNICYGQFFHSMPPGFNFQTRTLFADTSDGSVYAGGGFWQLNDGTPMYGISKWNGVNWDTMGAGLFGDLNSIIKYNGVLYAGGIFSIKDSAGNYISANLSIWNGQSWVLPPGGGSNSSIFKLRILGNNLYATGLFDNIGGVSVNRIAYFDGATWHGFPLLDSSTGGFGGVSDCIFYNGELFVGGDFMTATGIEDIAKFNGTNWIPVGGGLTGANTWVNDFEIYQNNLYVGGYFQTSNGDPGNNIAIWNGASWSQPSNGLMPSNVDALIIFNNELYAGGQIIDASGIPVTYIAKWDGMQWYSLNSVFNLPTGSFASNGNDLFIGGGFTTIDGDTMNYVTRYSPPLSVQENTWNANGLSILPNPSNGNFFFTSLFYSIESIRLFDLSGRVVFSNEKVIRNSYQCTLNSRDGIYIAEIFMNGNTYRNKILITR